MAETEQKVASNERITERNRIPMSLPLRKLEVPEISGYHTYWMADRPGRISQALRAGYEFVDEEEIGDLNRTGIGNDLTTSGNTDLGSRVSMVSGAENLYLMKIKLEWFKADQKLIADKNDAVMKSIMGGTIGKEGEDGKDGTSKRYLKTAEYETEQVKIK